ncbi:MAG: hypothetical protein L0H96_18480 [Humibacillus sp.]|nr:hypothetical protein [Humibacillus sp.]MDN5778886.1 hypothetical protein [Humibacillus sp.]
MNYRLLICGGALVCVGGALGFAGLAVGGTALVLDARRRIKTMKAPAPRWAPVH